MTTQEINRKLHEALGKCWHEWDGEYDLVCEKCRVSIATGGNPDFCKDARLVIEAMQQREDWPEFLTRMSIIYLKKEFVDLIMNREGKLALLAIAWLKEEK